VILRGEGGSCQASGCILKPASWLRLADTLKMLPMAIPVEARAMYDEYLILHLLTAVIMARGPTPARLTR
jgi:hypothetical protein